MARPKKTITSKPVPRRVAGFNASPSELAVLTRTAKKLGCSSADVLRMMFREKYAVELEAAESQTP